jgi:hypothetical protein
VSQIAYPLKEAAAAVGVSVDVLRQAIHTTNPASFPPPIRAKKVGRTGSKKFAYSIAAAELERWHSSLPDA